MILPGLNPFTATSARQSVRNGKPFLLSPPPRVFSHLPLACFSTNFGPWCNHFILKEGYWEPQDR